MDRRQFLKRAALSTVAAATVECAGSVRPQSSTGKRPNILFIMLDDLGPEWVSCYGAEGIKTPNIDALARGGIRFTNAYSMPKCTPTRVTLLTGQYPFRHGWVNHWDVPRWGAGCHFDPKHNTTFAHILKKAGYATVAVGKWQISDFRVQPDAMSECGFDEYCMWTGFETGNPPSGKRYWDPYLHTRDGSRTYNGRFSEDIFSDFLIDFMKRNRNRPMLMYYPMCLPHGPLTTTPLEPAVTGKRDMFSAMVRYCDHILGKLVKALDSLGLRDNTIIIWTTDNGTAGGMSNRVNGRTVAGGKGKISENGCGAPFIVNCPGRVPAGVVTEALTDFTDMLPTFAELAGAELPRNTVIDGRSIAPFILGKARDTDRRWIMAMGGGVARLKDGRVIPAVEYADRVVRDKRYKLWVTSRGDKLFDMIADPGEQNDLIESGDPAVVEARKRLQAVVRRFPSRDAAPRYDPTPPRPWDRKESTRNGRKKK